MKEMRKVKEGAVETDNRPFPDHYVNVLAI